MSHIELSLVVLVVGILFISQSIKVVPQQHAWVVERFGKYHATLSPGLNLLLPFVDKVAHKHVLKEIPLDVPSQVCITRDNTQLQVGIFKSPTPCAPAMVRLTTS
jgi:regulator of protease activity HflC (stomatin/prohibitin superfamily)